MPPPPDAHSRLPAKNQRSNPLLKASVSAVFREKPAPQNNKHMKVATSLAWCGALLACTSAWAAVPVTTDLSPSLAVGGPLSDIVPTTFVSIMVEWQRIYHVFSIKRFRQLNNPNLPEWDPTSYKKAILEVCFDHALTENKSFQSALSSKLIPSTPNTQLMNLPGAVLGMDHSSMILRVGGNSADDVYWTLSDADPMMNLDSAMKTPIEP